MGFDLIEIVGVLVTVLAVYGVILNNGHNKKCFIVWFYSNALSLIVHASLMCWSLTVRDLIFMCLAYVGYKKWLEFEKSFKEKSQ